MPRVRITAVSVTSTAVELVDQAGLDALSLSAVAKTLGVGPSALYTHCDGLEGLRSMVTQAAVLNLATELRNAAIGYAGDDALLALGFAYRRFAVDHPGQFAATVQPPNPDDEQLVEATQLVLDVFVLVFRAMGFGEAEAITAAGSIRSAIHGFLAIEQTTPEHSFQHLLDVLCAGLKAND